MTRPHSTPAERAAHGVSARAAVPPAAHSEVGPGKREDPVSILQHQASSRIPELVPVRYGRMLVSPFAFFRGAAAVMAADLAATPNSSLRAQICGDAHLANFGLFASPERHLLFDVNDFDETYAGPWEWDVKRLAASLVIAARERSVSAKDRRKIVVASVERYREAMASFAQMGNLSVWYAHADLDEVGELLAAQLEKARRKDVAKQVSKVRTHDSLHALAKLTTVVDGRRRIRADPPLIVPLSDLAPFADEEQIQKQIRTLLDRYLQTLATDRQVLMETFDYVDMARKVVGVGSVGTRCWIVLLRGRDDGDPLFLQVKEAQRSVLADHVPADPDLPRFDNEGERVVAGQRLMQAASDIFLGWDSVEEPDGQRRDYYVRQLRDWKGSANVETMTPAEMRLYGEVCGWTLARAHACSGDRIAIVAYLGSDDVFARALADFAETYADQNERDHSALAAAAQSRGVPAEAGV
jgi:uncharacterized protein (DUF2252 family)